MRSCKICSGLVSFHIRYLCLLNQYHNKGLECKFIFQYLDFNVSSTIQPIWIFLISFEKAFETGLNIFCRDHTFLWFMKKFEGNGSIFWHTPGNHKISYILVKTPLQYLHPFSIIGENVRNSSSSIESSYFKLLLHYHGSC